MSQPNILFIMTDQLRWDAVGAAGGWVRTPNIDRIASEGILFSQCVTNSPVCIPARVSLATGQYPHNTGVCTNINYDLPPDTPTWMQAVRRAGYRTSLFGKTHLHRHAGDLRDREDLMRAYGYDEINEIGGPRASMKVKTHMTEEWEKLGLWEGYIQDYKERFASKPYLAKPAAIPLEHYADVYVARKAQEYLENYNHDKPWFCTVSFGGPHEPWDAPEPYASLYDPDTMPKPVRRPDQQQGPSGYLHKLMEKGDRHSPDMSDAEIAAMRANYAGNVTLIDDQIGDILGTLEKKGELDRTVIVFTSDHGEMNGDYGLLYKENMLNPAVRIPLIIQTPETKLAGAPLVCEEMVELFDVGPTIVELCGGTMNHTHFAKSLVPVMNDPAQQHRTEALIEVHGEFAIQNQDWKLAVNRDGEPYLLFHLQDDPQEQHNRVHDPACREVLDQLRARMLERIVGAQVYR